MKPGLCPDFPVFAGDWLSSTAITLMTPAEEGGYFRLLCHAWADAHCCLPDDAAALAALSRLGDTWRDGSGAKIRSRFISDPERPGFIFNTRQRAVRDDQTRRITAIREQRRGAVNSRWAKAKSDTGRNTGVIREGIRNPIRKHTSSPVSPSPVTQRDIGQAVAAPASGSDSDWLVSLKSNPAYKSLDVDREHAKMLAWCAVHQKQPTRRRFINWLNRADTPLSGKRTQADHAKGF